MNFVPTFLCAEFARMRANVVYRYVCEMKDVMGLYLLPIPCRVHINILGLGHLVATYNYNYNYVKDMAYNYCYIANLTPPILVSRDYVCVYFNVYILMSRWVAVRGRFPSPPPPPLSNTLMHLRMYHTSPVVPIELFTPTHSHNLPFHILEAPRRSEMVRHQFEEQCEERNFVQSVLLALQNLQ